MHIDVETPAPIPETVERLLRELPAWFGVEAALRDYVASARHLPTFAARLDGTIVGVCLVKPHAAHAAEIYLLAVTPDLHRRGIGRALLEAVEQQTVGQGRELLQVKTLGASTPLAGVRRNPTFLRSPWLPPSRRVSRWNDLARQPLPDHGQAHPGHPMNGESRTAADRSRIRQGAG